MRILSRYFLRSYLVLFAAILFASLLIISVVEMLLKSNEILKDHEGIGGVARYLLLRLPFYYLRDLIPVTSFAAAFLCLGLPARSSEITAMKAGGISPRRAVVPVLAAALTLSAAALVVNETVVLKASRAWNRLDSAGEEVTFGRGSFWYHRGNVIYNVRDAERRTRTLRGVSVFELNAQGRLVRSIIAEQVRVADDHRWEFLDATIRSFEPSSPAAPPVIERAKQKTLEIARERDLALLDASAATLSLWNLSRYIEAHEAEGRDMTRYSAMLHVRLAEPLTVLLFALLAIPVGLAVEHSRSLAVCALRGIVIVGIFFTIRTAASMFAAGALAPPTISPWVTLTLFGGFGAWRLARVPT